jgi:hypothetical protein
LYPDVAGQSRVDTLRDCLEPSPREPGLAVFFIRRAVFDSGIETEIWRIIDSCGFEVLRSIDLDDEQTKAVATATRGGNWGPGAFTVDGGPPMRLLVAFDVKPTRLTNEQRQRYPHLENGHILEAKLKCREFISEKMPLNGRFDPVHSTDTSAQAWDVVRMIVPDEESSLRETIKDREAAFATRFEVVRDLTRTGLRSKIEVIRYGGGRAVKKTFRHNCLRFMEREYSFMEDVSPHRPEIPPVLERGPNYLIMPFVEGRTMRRFVFGRGFPRLMTLGKLDRSRTCCAFSSHADTTRWILDRITCLSIAWGVCAQSILNLFTEQPGR